MFAEIIGDKFLEMKIYSHFLKMTGKINNVALQKKALQALASLASGKIFESELFLPIISFGIWNEESGISQQQTA